MSGYTLLYDARLTPFWTWNELFPLFVPSIFAAAVYIVRDQRLSRKVARWVAGGGTVVVLLLTGLLFGIHQQLCARLEDGNYLHVDGVIEGFQPGAVDGHREEIFTVYGHTYRFFAGKSVPGYHAVQGESGPIHDGARARIADVNGSIARFEVAP